jgi:hypothetical protein
MIPKTLIVLSMLASILSFAPVVSAQQDNAENQAIRFRNPVRIKAGEKFLGAKRLYPSPVVHDVNSDGRPDVVVGDLWGKVTFAPRLSDKANGALGTEKKFLAADGKQLDFSSW